MLDGATVIYGSASELYATLEYDFSEERKFSYKGLDINAIIKHLAHFISRLWQIHIFGEGNTRTTAVFFIKYLRTLGFDATNEIFAENAWYFRNSLVRANYTNLQKGIHETTEFLELFIRNLLLNEKNTLSNKLLHINAKTMPKPDIEGKKPDIKDKKPDIGFIKSIDSLSKKTKAHIEKLFSMYGFDKPFGRGDVEILLGLKSSATSELLKKMLDAKITEPVLGLGKGKYVFKRHN